MCTLSERLKRNNYQLKIDADFLGGRGCGGEVARGWGSKWEYEYKFQLKCPIAGRCFGSSFPPLLVFCNNHCVSEKLGKS